MNFTQGKNQSVVEETDQDLQQYVSTVVENGVLVLSIKNPEKKNLQFKKLLVTIEAPRLESVSINSGAAFTTSSHINERNFKAETTSGATLKAEVNAENEINLEVNSGANTQLDANSKGILVNATSGSMAKISGKADRATFTATSAANCNAQDLIAETVETTSTSAANLKIHATKSLSATAPSGATIVYKGQPGNIGKINKNSGATIKQIN